VSEVCSGSRACGTPRASAPCSAWSATSFGPGATRSRPPTIAQWCAGAGGNGTSSRKRRRPPSLR